MSWTQKEKAVREKRTIEATKKNFMGPAGKLGLIAQTLGHQIIRQGTGIMDVTYLEDPYDNDIETEFEKTISGQDGPQMYQETPELPEFQDEINFYEGYVFDGLSRGMHLEIKYWNRNQKLEVTYKGYQVYKEIGGELFAYAPFDDWEDLITRLYKVAKPRSKELKEQREVELGEKIQKRKSTFWEKLQTRWGV